VDFIERILGISPDGGNGMTEALILIALVAIGAAVAWQPVRRRLLHRGSR